MSRKILSGKVAAIAVMLAMACGFVSFFGILTVKAASHEITESYVGYYDQYHQGDHQMHYRAKMHKVNGEMAYCIAMTKPSEPGKAKEVSIKKFLPGDELVMTCLAQKHIFDMQGYTTEEKYMLTQCMVWYIQRDHIGDGGWRQYVSDIDMSVNEQKTFFAELEQKVKKEAPSYEGHGTAWENIDVADVQEVGVLLAPTLKTGDLTLRKVSSVPEITKGNNCYSLAGAEYGIYTDAACTKLTHVMKTGEDGNTEKITLEAGKYYVKEIRASKGYELDKNVYPVTVEFGENKVLDLKEVPASVPLELYLEKLDKETGVSAPQGNASLEGAEFTVCYYDGFYTKDNLPDYDSYGSTAKRKWIVRTMKTEKDGKAVYAAHMPDEECKAGGDPYYVTGGKAALPVGTLRIEETKAPKGYKLDGFVFKNINTGERIESGAYVTQIVQGSDSNAALSGGNHFEIADQVLRGDLSLRKIDEEHQKAMAGIEFRLTSVTTGESHTFITDENGEYNTSSEFIKHTVNTNGGKEGDGIWFGMSGDGKETPADDKAGALPYDTYELEELSGRNNSGMAMYKDMITIKRDAVVVRMNNIENHGISIQTMAREKDSGEQETEAKNPVTIVDTVQYNNLKKDSLYRLVGTVMDKDSKSPLKGKEKDRVISEKIFSAKERDGSVQMEFSFDSIGLKGREIVIFEELYEIEDEEDPGILTAQHKDFEAKEQTIYFRELKITTEEPKEDKPKISHQKVKITEEKSQGVKTGDNNSLMHLVILLILSCVAIFTCGRIARKD